MRRSFQGRVAVLMMLWTGILATLFGAASWFLILSQAIAVADHILLGWAERALPAIQPWERVDHFESQLPNPRFYGRDGERAICIIGLGGEELYTTPGAAWLARYARIDIPTPTQDRPAAGDDKSVPGPRQSLHTISDPEGDLPWRLLRIETPDVVVLAGFRMAAFEAGLSPLKQYFLFGLIGGLILVLIGAWLTARQALVPLRRVSEAAAAIKGSANLTDRIPTTSKDYVEFRALVDSLNSMMSRLEKNFQQATRFTADASHELKTPIALLQAAVDTGLKTARPGSVEESHFLNLSTEVSRLKKISEALLLLSRADSGHLTLDLQRFDLSGEMETLCEDAEFLAEERELTFDYQVQRDISVMADRILLMQAVQNLVTNAIKYNRPEGRVDLSCVGSDGTAIIEVGNTGPAIPPEQQSAIFDRFHRVDRARADEPGGTGLGLNLASEIANAHRGSLELVSGEADAIRFRLSLPLAPAL